MKLLVFLAMGLLASAIAATAEETSICGAPVNQTRGQIIWTRVLCKEPGRYIGWPSVCYRPQSKEVLAVFSGDRDAHVCPWGKVQLVRSADNGETWAAPETICNGPLDDRDAGITALANGDLIVAWFTSLAFEEEAQSKGRFSPYALHAGKIPMETKARELGYFTVRSTDDGKTWDSKAPTYGQANHGCIQLKDGRLLMVGRRCPSGIVPAWKAVKFELTVEESKDQGRSWQKLATILPSEEEEARLADNFHEPHVVETADGRLVAQFRCHLPGNHLRQAESSDGGRTWTRLAETPLSGFPPHLIRLADGKLLTVYGRRWGSFGEYACVSDDGGKTWDVKNEIKLCGHWNGDLGYPSSVQLPDGAILTVYYQAEKNGEKTCLMGTKWKLLK